MRWWIAVRAVPLCRRTVRPFELLRLSMKDGNLPHYGLLQSICDTLPGVSPQTQEEVQKMAGYGPSRRDCWPEWLR